MAKQNTGRPPFEPTQEMRDTVEGLSAAGLTQDKILRLFNKLVCKISGPTLRKHFKDELALSTDNAVANVAGMLYQRAMAGEGWAVCFFLKTRGMWRETNRVELENLGNVPGPNIAISFAKGGPGFGGAPIEEGENAGGAGPSQPET